MNKIAGNDDIAGKILFNKYKPEKKLGEGSFGKIYSAVNVMNGEHFALKMEPKDGGQNLLEGEAYFLCYLKGPGIPVVKSYGFSGNFNIMVMELLGKSLEDIFQDQKKKFSIKTVCMIADQMLQRIEFIHNKHIIHRDIKPDNFVMGLGNKATTVYLLDFGLAKKYRSSRTLQHIKFTINKKLTGTARYASINALRGCEQSRRDDLEAIGYVLMYFLRGSLPWQGLKVDKKEDRYKKIYEKKKATSPEELCAGFPGELAEYIRYTRNLEFEQNPDYEYLRGLFRKIMEGKYEYDFRFDWIKNLPQIGREKSDVTKSTSLKPSGTAEEGGNQINLSNTKDIMNSKHLQTHLDGDFDNQREKKQHNERIDTRFANYNTTVQVTDNNQQNLVPIDKENGEKQKHHHNHHNNDHEKENNDQRGLSPNAKEESRKKKKKEKKDGRCNVF